MKVGRGDVKIYVSLNFPGPRAECPPSQIKNSGQPVKKEKHCPRCSLICTGSAHPLRLVMLGPTTTVGEAMRNEHWNQAFYGCCEVK